MNLHELKLNKLYFINLVIILLFFLKFVIMHLDNGEQKKSQKKSREKKVQIGIF